MYQALCIVGELLHINANLTMKHRSPEGISSHVLLSWFYELEDVTREEDVPLCRDNHALVS